jgi:tetratricopeptide (TPR) repeat protein
MLTRLEARLALKGGLAALCLSLPATPLWAEPLPPMERVFESEDPAIVREFATLLTDVSSSEAEKRAALESLLGRLSRPNMARGMIQFLRASLLLELDDHHAARAALEEAIRLLPGYSAPLLMASMAEAYSDRPEHAIDYLLRASRIDPETVKQIPDYELSNILSRSGSPAYSRQRRELAARLFEIGWQGGSLGTRASLAADVIEAKIEVGDIAGARALVPQLVSPGSVRALLMLNKYRELWPALEEWAGPRQERLWPIYLGELKARWEASRDPEHGRPYLGALSGAGHDQTIVDTFLPTLETVDPERDFMLVFVVAPVADALARLGRWNDIEPFFERAQRIWPLGENANALNILTNRGRLRFYRGDFVGAVADLRKSLSDPAVATGEVGSSATLSIHYYLACALHRLGRDAEALGSTAAVMASGSVGRAVSLHVCRNEMDQARAALIAALADEDQRETVVGYVQQAEGRTMQSDVARELRARYESLRTDPGLHRAIEPYGRVLPYSYGAGAPTEEQKAVRL